MLPIVASFAVPLDGLRALCASDKGASTPEYALLLAFIALGTIGAVVSLKDQIITLFTTEMITE